MAPAALLVLLVAMSSWYGPDAARPCAEHCFGDFLVALALPGLDRRAECHRSRRRERQA